MKKRGNIIVMVFAAMLTFGSLAAVTVHHKHHKHHQQWNSENFENGCFFGDENIEDSSESLIEERN